MRSKNIFTKTGQGALIGGGFATITVLLLMASGTKLDPLVYLKTVAGIMGLACGSGAVAGFVTAKEYEETSALALPESQGYRCAKIVTDHISKVTVTTDENLSNTFKNANTLLLTLAQVEGSDKEYQVNQLEVLGTNAEVQPQLRLPEESSHQGNSSDNVFRKRSNAIAATRASTIFPDAEEEEQISPKGSKILYLNSSRSNNRTRNLEGEPSEQVSKPATKSDESDINPVFHGL